MREKADILAIPMTLALDWAAANREAGGKRYDAALRLTSLAGFPGAGQRPAGPDGPGAPGA